MILHIRDASDGIELHAIEVEGQLLHLTCATRLSSKELLNFWKASDEEAFDIATGQLA